MERKFVQIKKFLFKFQYGNKNTSQDELFNTYSIES